jgi:hypothetical protein
MGTREIRIATLPPEVTDRVIKEALTQYGEEIWTTSYRYTVSNGVRLAKTKLKHLPSRIVIAGHSVTLHIQASLKHVSRAMK